MIMPALTNLADVIWWWVRSVKTAYSIRQKRSSRTNHTKAGGIKDFVFWSLSGLDWSLEDASKMAKDNYIDMRRRYADAIL